ncbi:MAG: CDP-alcohol phosphatidyltransferase family protein [Acidimicrobiia bacterium]|nr:CDP-alcohol phosphatidyltransferase family protein [Acidimicrobiia bacterium]
MTAPAPPVRRFGQSALRTPANMVTIGRLLLAGPSLVLVHRDGATWATVGLWFVLSMSDLADGYLARREGTTRSGAFLDPIADKVLVLGALWVLAGRGDVPWAPFVVISARELAISAVRGVAGRRGVSMPARRLGKYKTFLQNSAIGFVLLPWTARYVGFQETVLWAAVAFTVVSGADILLNMARRDDAER